MQGDNAQNSSSPLQIQTLTKQLFLLVQPTVIQISTENDSLSRQLGQLFPQVNMRVQGVLVWVTSRS
jgi:hypothetical protein